MQWMFFDRVNPSIILSSLLLIKGSQQQSALLHSASRAVLATINFNISVDRQLLRSSQFSYAHSYASQRTI